MNLERFRTHLRALANWYPGSLFSLTQLIALKIISADGSATRRETGLAPILGQACFTDKSFAMRGRIEVRVEVVPPQRMRE